MKQGKREVFGMLHMCGALTDGERIAGMVGIIQGLDTIIERCERLVACALLVMVDVLRGYSSFFSAIGESFVCSYCFGGIEQKVFGRPVSIQEHVWVHVCVVVVQDEIGR